MIGRDVSIPISELADPAWDYVAMGHIHKHQNLTQGRRGLPPVVYSGSMERIDFGEEDEHKGFCWVELERGNTSWQFIPVKARPFITLRIDVRHAADPTQKVIDIISHKNLEDAVVRLIIQADEESENRLREVTIQNALREARVGAIAGVQKDIERPTRTRLGANPEGLTPVELLERYFKSKDIDDARIQVLLAHAEPFLNSDNI